MIKRIIPIITIVFIIITGSLNEAFPSEEYKPVLKTFITNITPKSVIIAPFKATQKEYGQKVAQRIEKKIKDSDLFQIIPISAHTKELSIEEMIVFSREAGAQGIIYGYVESANETPLAEGFELQFALMVEMIYSQTGEKIYTIRHRKEKEKSSLPLEYLMDEVIEEIFKEIQNVYMPALKQETKGSSPSLHSDKPHTPRNFHVSQKGLRQAEITWSRPYDDPDKYIIEFSTKPDGPFTRIASISPKKECLVFKGTESTTLEDNTRYYFRMFALSKDETMSEITQPEASITAPPPDPPINLKASANKSRGIFLTWDLPSSEGVTHFIIQRKQVNKPDTFKDIAEIDKTSFYQDGGTSKTELLDSTDYIYRIISRNKVDSIGLPSDPVIVKTLPPPAPVKTASVKNDEVRCIPLSWLPSEEGDVVKYLIYRRETPKSPFIQVAEIKGRNKTYYLDGEKNPGNLKDGHTYYYRIYAVNEAGAISLDPPILEGVTRSRPPIVDGLNASSNEPRQVTLSWKPSDDEKVVGYDIWRAEEDEAFTPWITIKKRETSSFVDTGKKRFGKKGKGDLKDGTTYRYKIFATNIAGAPSDSSTIVQAQTKKVPEKPASIVVTVEEQQYVRLLWHANPEPDILEYRVEYASYGKTRFKSLAIITTKTGQTSFTYIDEKNPIKKKKIWYRIQAVDKDLLESPWSDPVFLEPQAHE